MRYVLKYLILDISEGVRVPEKLVQQCKFVMQQQEDIAIERFVQLKEQGYYPTMKLSGGKTNFESIRDQAVFENVNEFFSFQTYNTQILSTLNYLASLE
jgi:hypothetical protein